MSKRQFEPRSILQARPVRPTSLSATIQGADPLALHLLPHPVELALTVMQPEVLIEAPQHLGQMLLLLPSSPVSVMKDPLPGPSQKITTTLSAGDSNQSKSPLPIHPTDMFEAQKFERLRPSQSVRIAQRVCAESSPRPAPDRIPRTAPALSVGSGPPPVDTRSSPRNRQRNARGTPRLDPSV